MISSECQAKIEKKVKLTLALPMRKRMENPLVKEAVIAAVIQKNGRFLFGRRSPWKKSAPNYWAPISGRVEPGESQKDAVKRECLEEAGIKVETQGKVGEFDANDGSCRLYWWMAEIVGGEPHLANDEHTELAWFSVDEMVNLDKVFQKDIDLLRSLSSR